MTILALDLATKCGWASLRPDGRVESGEELFDVKSKEGPGMRFVKFRRWLIDIKGCLEVTDIAYEEVIGHGPGQVYAAQIHGGFVAILQAFCESHAIRYKGYSVGTIKKQFTGSGNAKKPDMIKRCRELGFAPATDNEADALAILHVATGRTFSMKEAA